MIPVILSFFLSFFTTSLAIAFALRLAFRVTGRTEPTFRNLWTSAAAACIVIAAAGVIATDGQSGGLTLLLPIALGLMGTHVAYAHLLKQPCGRPMDRGAARVAVVTHLGFLLAISQIVWPMFRTIVL